MAEATLKKIAELTGISIRSVNRALHGTPGVSKVNQEKVLAAASLLGYVPNVAARNLRLKRNNFIGVVVPYAELRPSGYNINSRKIGSLQLRLEQDGYFTLFGMNTGAREDMEKLLRQWNGLVSSVIFFAWCPDWDPRELLGKMPQQFIFVDRIVNYGHSLVLDRASGIYDGIRFLLDNGCRKLARCGGIPSRDTGFTAALADLRDHPIEHRHFSAGSNFDDGFKIAPELIEGRYDAVFFDTDRMAFGFLKYCWMNGIRIPEDISVIGFDDEPWDMYSCPSLSTVAHPIEEMNETISALVRNPVRESGKWEFKTRFVQRESVYIQPSTRKGKRS